MCGGGNKSSQPVPQVDVTTVASKPNRGADQAGTFTNTPGAVAANAAPSQSFGAELGTTGG